MRHHKIEASYLRQVFSPEDYRELVSRVARAVQHCRTTMGAEAIAFRGTSGAALAFPVGYWTGLSLCHVSKPDRHHAPSCGVEGAHGVGRYVIVDDMIDSGSTLEIISGTMRRASPGAKCVAVILYNYGWTASPTDEATARRLAGNDACVRIHCGLAAELPF